MTTLWPYIIYAQIFSINPCCFVLQPPMERNSKKTTSPPHVSISLVPFWCVFVLSKRIQLILLSCVVCQLGRNPRIDLSGSLRCTKLRPRIILTLLMPNAKSITRRRKKMAKYGLSMSFSLYRLHLILWREQGWVGDFNYFFDKTCYGASKVGNQIRWIQWFFN